MIDVDKQIAETLPWEDESPTNNSRVLIITTSTCEPCKKMVPDLAVVHNSGHKFEVYKATVDTGVGSVAILSERYEVTSVPTLVLFDPEGNKVKAHTGVLTIEELIHWLGITMEYPTL